jgi:hypothetical protein
MRSWLLISALAAAGTLAAVPVALSDPSNDGRDDATLLQGTPHLVSGTTRDAHADDGESSACGESEGSVWYRFDARKTQRIVAKLAAGGDLDAVLDVDLRERSQQTPLTCDASDRNGRAAVAFTAQRGQSYLLRVAQRTGPVAGDFKLRVAPAPGTRLPGAPLPDGGISGSLDRVGRTLQVWSTHMRQGRRYRVRLLHGGPGCLRASVYRAGRGPSTGTGEALARIGCNGYGLFTPRPGQGTRFSIFVFAAGGVRGQQRYHLQAAPAGRDDSAPGRFVANYGRARGRLDGAGVDDVDLFRFDVTRRSALFLGLRTPNRRAALDLVLLDPFGNVVRCACDGTGNARLVKGLRPGRYFVAARARGGASARYTLLRASRTITKTSLRVDGGGQALLAPGQPATITVRTQPVVDGPVTVTLEQFDPLSGWQYVRRVQATAHAGVATVRFTPPSEGRWRATAAFRGTRGKAPSKAPNFVRMLVAAPLKD